jgi:nanoRNase/pAp phosphatase (c-di-AMP/oligoRNAs hydrolase)
MLDRSRQTACFEKVNFDVVIDHHPVTVKKGVKFIDIRPNYGAASSIMVEYLRAANIKPSVALATALFYGIKVDTQNFEKNAQPADGSSFRYLFSLANLNLVRKLELTDLRRSELKYFKIALNELKVSKGKAFVHVGRVWSPDILVIIYYQDGRANRFHTHHRVTLKTFSILPFSSFHSNGLRT